jgi:nucleotide-binding universal stress UspA family protein
MNTILFPCDFHKDSQIALRHAAFLATNMNAQILMLHIVEHEYESATKLGEMDVWKEKLQRVFTGPIETRIEEGDFKRDIGAIAAREKCKLVVMPTHGIRGIQHLTGSDALRVVSNSHIPFVVVQQREMREHGYKNIVVPIHFRPQVIDEAKYFISIAKQFNSKVHFIAMNEHAANFNQKIVDSVLQLFKDENIECELEVENSSSGFHKHVVRFAGSVDADLICSVNFAYEFLYTLFPRTEEENLIYNDAQIPVMLITPEKREDGKEYLSLMWH